MSKEYVIVLRIIVDDETDDPRRWPYGEMLQAPDDDEATRYVGYESGWKIDRR